MVWEIEIIKIVKSITINGTKIFAQGCTKGTVLQAKIIF